jgi:Heterokaryon incompatibility protein (HET)
MLNQPSSRQSWPTPVDLLFQVMASPNSGDDDDETVFSAASNSISSLSSNLGPVTQKWVYPGAELHGSNSIRLLKIQGAPDQKTKIACTLQTVDLVEHPRYRTLSYTGGPAVRAIGSENRPSSPGQGQQILCNDQLFFVTQNLQDALLELRQSVFTNWLWVDAICIDQSNADERAHQVSAMGRIYRSATETIAWLGKDESGTDDVQWGIEVMIPKLLERGSAFWDSRPLTDPELETVFGVENLSDRLVGIKKFLATRRWFDRAWVAQEVALAPAVFVRAGKQQFSWTDLTNLSIVLSRVSWDNELVPRLPEFEKGYSAAKAFLENMHGLRDLIHREVVGHVSQPASEMREIYKFLQARYGTKTELELAAAWLAHLLSLVRSMGSSEKHDKIYSIIGVANVFSSRIGEFVMPDYHMPFEMVSTSLTAALLLSSRYLTILTHVGDISNNQLTNIPSWVVDYSSTNATTPILTLGEGQATHFDASLTSESLPFPRKIEDTRLTLMGARFDHLTLVSPATLAQVVEDTSVFEDFLNCVAHLPDRYLDGQPRTEIVWRTMIMDSEETVGSINHPPPSSFAKGFQAWIINMIGLWVADVVKTGMGVDAANESARRFFAQLYPDTQIDVPEEAEGNDEVFASYQRKRMLPFVRSIGAKVCGRKLFKSLNNLVGMGSSSVEAGDEIWLIRDSRTPLILRPKPGTQDFLLVGEAYLHGFMHGEMLDDRWGLNTRVGPVTIV